MVQAASEVQEHGAVDDRDTFLHGVRDLLSIHSSRFWNSFCLHQIMQSFIFVLWSVLFLQTDFIYCVDSQGALPTYVSAHGLVQQIAGLQSDLQSLQLELETALPEDRRRCVNEL